MNPRSTRARYSKTVIAASGGYTTSRDTNVAGLSSAITLATELRLDFLAHVADQGAAAGEHKALHSAAVLTSAVPTNLATLLALVNSMTTKYALHDTDAAAASPTYHIAQAASRALAAETAVTTLVGAITRLNDMKAKLNLHAASAAAHRTGVATLIAAADSALGVAIFVTDANIIAGMVCSWAILKAGTGTPTGVSAACANGGITFTFSAEPNADTIISYAVYSSV